MTRLIAFFAVATLLGGCVTTSNVAKDHSDVVSGGPIKNAPTSSGTPPTRATPGFYAKEDVVRPVNLRVADIQACYEEQLKEHPRLSGRVDVSWTIGLDGRVTEVSTKGLDEVSECIESVIKSIQFRPPYGVPEVISGYPFVFNVE